MVKIDQAISQSIISFSSHLPSHDLPFHSHLIDHLTTYHLIIHLISSPSYFSGVQHVMNPDMYRGMFADLEDGVDRFLG